MKFSSVVVTGAVVVTVVVTGAVGIVEEVVGSPVRLLAVVN